jgi:CRP-like cAMP-binding protein
MFAPHHTPLSRSAHDGPTCACQDVDFAELPSHLSTQLTLELHKTLVKKCAIFSALPPKLVVPLLRKLQPLVAVPGEVVVREGHINEKLFFIHRGTVHVIKAYGTVDEEMLALLESNDFFGEASLLPDEAANANAPPPPASDSYPVRARRPSLAFQKVRALPVEPH